MLLAKAKAGLQEAQITATKVGFIFKRIFTIVNYANKVYSTGPGFFVLPCFLIHFNGIKSTKNVKEICRQDGAATTSIKTLSIKTLSTMTFSML